MVTSIEVASAIEMVSIGIVNFGLAGMIWPVPNHP